MYVQCKTKEELELYLEQNPNVFVTEDLRVYDKISFSDSCGISEFSPEDFEQFDNLKFNIQNLSDPFQAELSFEHIVDAAKTLERSFKEVQKLLTKPKPRKGKSK